MEKIVKKGFLIADIKLEFDAEGNIKDNYEISGSIKDNKLNVFKKYDFQKLNLVFEYKKGDLSLNNISFSLNDLKFISEGIFIKKNQNDFQINGNINHKKFDVEKKNLDLFIKPYLSEIDIEELKLSSSNNFSFKINQKFEIKDFKLDSKEVENSQE